MAFEKLKTHLKDVDTLLHGGIKKDNVTIISGRKESARARADLCHRLCVVSQISEEDEPKRVIYLDFSRVCSFRPDKMLLRAKSLPLHGVEVLRNVIYRRININGDQLREQEKLLVEAMKRLQQQRRRFSLLVLNDFPMEMEGLTDLNRIAKENKIVIIINNVIHHDDTDTMRVYFNEITDVEQVNANANAIPHISMKHEFELKFPAKGMTASTISEAIETISASNGDLFWSGQQLWKAATDLRDVFKKESIGFDFFKAIVHLVLCSAAFILEQIKEFKIPEGKSVIIVGLLVASAGALLWAWEIRKKWIASEQKWYNWPFFPATVGLIVELNQVAFYLACLVDHKPPRMVVSGLLFHVSNVIRLVAKEKKNRMKKMLVGNAA